VAWNGETVAMSLARSGSGSRYVNKAADLEWWIKGHEATMFRLSNHAVLLNCREG
jgi:membrane-bound inhibitor of C-type lysozyme